MKETGITRRYARALFMAIEDNSSVSREKVHKYFVQLSSLFMKDERVRGMLKNPQGSVEDKKNILKKKLGLGTDESSKLFFNFIDLLITQKRVSLIPLILSRFEYAMQEALGKMNAYVSSATKLDAKTEKHIVEKLSSMFSKKITLETTVNPELIAGLVIKAGDTLIDNSLRKQLENMKATVQS